VKIWIVSLTSAALAGLIVALVSSPPRTGSPAAVDLVAPGMEQSDEIRRLAEQVKELQRSIDARGPEAARLQPQIPAPEREAANPDPSPTDPAQVEALRAAAAARHHEFMSGVAQSFGNEKLEPRWAKYAAAQVSAAFEGDAALRNLAHTVDCRERTCRVEIADDESGALSLRLPMLAMSLAGTLPTVVSERMDRGNGHSAVVLYFSSQNPTAPGVASR